MVSGGWVFRTPGGVEVRALAGHPRGGIVVSAGDLMDALGVPQEGCQEAIRKIPRGMWQAKFHAGGRRGEPAFNEEAAYAYLHFERRVSVSQRSSLRRWLADEVFPAMAALFPSPFFSRPSLEASVSPVENFTPVLPGRALVSAAGGVPTTTSLVIADGTDNEHASVIRLVRTYQSDLERFGLVRFEIRPRSAGQHGGGDVEFAILNQEQATLLLTLMRNSEVVVRFKVALVKAFWELSRVAAQEPPTFVIPKTLHEALRLASDLEEQRSTLAAKVEADAPKVEFAMAVRNCDETLTVAKFAKLLGKGEVKFYRWLRDSQILYKHGKANLPYQRFIELGYFRVVENVIYMGHELGNVPVPQTLITGKGQVWLQKRWSDSSGSQGKMVSA